MVVGQFEKLFLGNRGFSKKIQNHAAAVALYFMYYNFSRVHQTLRVTPAMEARVADHVWTVEEMGLLESERICCDHQKLQFLES